MFLYDEWRGGDVGEEDTLGETELEDVQDEAFVAQDGSEIPERAQQALAGPAARRKRLPEQHRASEQDDADGQQDDEDAAPPDGIGQYAAEYRSRHRSDAVDDTDDGEDLDQLLAAVTVGGHGTGDDDAAGGPYALEEPHAHEYVYRGREDANHCGSDEQQQGDEEQRPPAELVAQRAEQQLSERETGHARREAHLYHRLRSAEINCHGGERRQVHVRHERTEGREDAEQDDKVVRVACRGRLGMRIGNTGLHCVLFCLQR